MSDSNQKLMDPKPARRPATSIAAILRHLRQQAGLTLSELAQRCGLAPSTLSKVENGQMSPTYDTILSLAQGLEVDVTELFAGKPSAPVRGRRTVTRKGQGAILATAQYDYEMLCADIAGKQFVPLFTQIKANSVHEFPTLISHAGEEFIYILSGSVTLHTEFYAPTQLEPGDSCYFDSLMGHALVSTADTPATLLWICSQVVAPLRA
ncbi:MAG TPA: XRE family transcriptional regulator [Devosiaceae bacterium]|jgi:transcriptional regulator with XRE-family HTH domain